MPYNFKASRCWAWLCQQRWRWSLLCGFSLLVGCTTALPPSVAPPVSTPIPTAAATLFTEKVTDKEAITALILAERQAAIEHNLILLDQLWADNAQIIDGRNSATSEDDYRWLGRAAILDRYTVAVFPFTLPPLPALDESTVITIAGDQATVQHLTDRWQLSKAEERWWLSELKYSYLPN